jgi:pyruvate/2-oxoglutarate dehydrogenase complex dihydrolipoamide dehydrogenase (E3) component
VIGAGPIGCELAQAFRRLGCEVVVLEVAPRILIREDPDAAALIQGVLEREGLDLRLGAKLRRVSRGPEGKWIDFEREGRMERICVDEILIGAGRAPNVQGLGLDSVNVAWDPQAGVHVDDTLRTSNPRIFAAGDVCLPTKFTHAADASAKLVVRNALFPFGRQKLSSLVIPWCTYTDPEVAHVGVYAHEAKQRGEEVDTYHVPLERVNRALIDGDEEGFVRIHAKRGTDRIVGGTIVARHAGEMISELTLAIAAKAGLGALGGVIHPYPTQAEGIKAAANAYLRTRLTPTAKRVLGAWLRATG